MTQAAYLVVVTLPPGMTPKQGRNEVKSSIGFGQPDVLFLFLEEDPPGEADPVG
jgi:hypothetical protein